MIQTTQQPRLFHPLEHLWDLIHLRRRIRQLQPQVPQTSGGGAAELKKKSHGADGVYRCVNIC